MREMWIFKPSKGVNCDDDDGHNFENFGEEKQIGSIVILGDIYGWLCDLRQ